MNIGSVVQMKNVKAILVGVKQIDHLLNGYLGEKENQIMEILIIQKTVSLLITF
jgi:hypothetical protein